MAHNSQEREARACELKFVTTQSDRARLIEVAIGELDDHPDNPRVAVRPDVVQGIAAALNESPYPQEHAIRVRPIGDRFQIVAGHHRVRAAAQLG